MSAILLYGAGESDANLYWATRFATPDPYAFVRIRGRSMIVVGDLEIGRARDEATVDEVLSLGELERTVAKAGKTPSTAEVLAHLLRARRAGDVSVPGDFPVHLADTLRQRGVKIVPKPGVFWSEREVKTPAEVRAIERTQRAVEAAVETALDVLRRAAIRGSRLVHRGETLTSESLRRVIHLALMEREATASDTIVSCGDQACDPHQRGTGPLRPHRSIIMDVFPRSLESGYFADMSRTVVKGRPSRELARIYDAVREAQELGIDRVRAGADGRAIHREIQEFFAKAGYRTEPRGTKMTGFFHGTGHGVGLDIHEAPWITGRGTPLPAGAVVTVEPGLYYPGIGGVRLEDMVLVTRSGCRNLTRFPKRLAV